MKRWPAIAALGVMAWPVSALIGKAFVGIVESWKYGPPASCSHDPATGLRSHCLTPITAVSPAMVMPLIGIVLLIAGLWWVGWFYQARSARRRADNPSALPASSLFLALWFVGATALSTAWAAHTHTFM